MDTSSSTPLAQQSDPELVKATRTGDTGAYAVLYERHLGSARRLARILAADEATADDLVSESFAKILQTLQEGGGPDVAFRPYLLRSMRNTFYDRVRRDKKVTFTDDARVFDADAATADDPEVKKLDKRYASNAFAKLPERWQMVLWHTEVEEDSPADIAPLLGMTPNGVAALAYRARERLRQLFLQEHIADSADENCRWTVDRLGAHVRGRLAARDSKKVDDHLSACVPCKILVMELAEVNSGMRGVLAPIVLGVAAGSYLATSTGIAAGAGFLAVLAEPFLQAANWIRRFFQQLGTKGSIATGTATATVIAAVAVALTLDDDPEPPESAAPPAVNESPAPEEPAEEPSEEDEAPDPPAPEPDPEPEPEPEPDPDDPEPDPDEPADPPEEPDPVTVRHGLGDRGLSAGGVNTLPIVLHGEEFAANREEARTFQQATPEEEPGEEPGGEPDEGPDEGPTTVTVTVPDGVGLASETTPEGWSCGAEALVVICSDAEADGSSDRVSIDLSLSPDLSGFQSFDVAVEGPGVSGKETLRLPVAPAGTSAIYSTTAATGTEAAGNTWMSCRPANCRHRPLWAPGENWWLHPHRGKGAPLAPAAAVSGATLSVPEGAEIQWAGLSWGGVDGAASQVDLWTDDGWTTVHPESTADRQAFAEVTGLVRSGEVWVAAGFGELPMGHCHDCSMRWAGWGLTVVYAMPGADDEVAVYQTATDRDFSLAVPAGEGDATYVNWGGSEDHADLSWSVGGRDLASPSRSRARGSNEGPGWYTFGVDVGREEFSLGAPGRLSFAQGSPPNLLGVVAVTGPGPD
ncbi:sigma-70 family RNA polymerase sigma factor [Salininema proteolyticum]|uniref:Sigma-70 family RNA polymerase sigma factor n=1 Tax=Salininema proteolyticum TaxID=1607685 RepID=A0ABV8TSM7_9ACTN